MNWSKEILEKPAWKEEISNREKKEEIARKVASIVKDGDVIGFGSGSTSYLAAIEIANNITKTAEEMASHGVLLKHDIWHVGDNSIFRGQLTPSLDYYVQLTKGLYEINKKYGLSGDMDSYRKCGMHPNINLDRI